MAPLLPLAWLGLFLALALLLPNHYSPWLSFHQEALAAVAFVPIVCWSVLRSQYVPRLVFGIALLALVPLTQWLLGLISYAGDAWIHSAFLLGAAVVLFAGHVVAQHAVDDSALDLHMRPLWLAFIMAGVVSVGMAAHQWLGLDLLSVFIADMPPAGRPFANLAQPNHLAALLLLAALGVWYGWEKRWLGTLSANLAVACFMVGMVLTGSRSVWLALAWLLPVAMWSRGRCGVRLQWQYLVIATAVFFSLSLAKPFFDEWLARPDTGTAIDRLAQTHLRLIAWKAFFNAALMEPWFGYGWGQIAAAQFRVVLDHPGLNDIFYSTHNLLLDLVIWQGFPFAVFVTGALIYWAMNSLLRCRDVDALLPLLAVGIVFGHSMVEFPIAYAYFLLPVAFWMGVVGERTTPCVSISRGKTSWSVRAATTLIFLATLALLVQICREYIPYEEDWREQQFVQAKISEVRTQRSTRLVLLDQLHDLMRMQRYAPLEEFIPSDVTWVRDAAERYPYPAFLFKYALTLALSAQPGAAADQLARLCAVFQSRVCIQVKKDWAMAASKDPRLSSVDLSRLP